MSERLQPIDSNFSWNEQSARHLLNRAGFGVPRSMVSQIAAAKPADAVDVFISYQRFPDNAPPTDFITPYGEDEYSKIDRSKLDIDERRKLSSERARQQRAEMVRLKTWWLAQMQDTSRPLQEKMALFWHGHFATSAREVKHPAYNLDILNVFRDNATGNFRTMVFSVGKTPAMLNYLNNKQNRKGKPNENWARELMELFTLGIGSYTEQDIKEAARAFSGYTERNGAFEFISSQHDYEEKTFLGKTGTFDGADVINIIMEQPETARFISRKIWEYLVYENPDDELVEELAEVFRRNDYELKPLLRTIFLSREFYGEKAMAGQIKSPAQFIVMFASQLGLEDPPAPLVNLAMSGLGQDLFYPPNVKGWPGNRSWIDTNTLLLRYNIPAYTILGERSPKGRVLELDEMVSDGRKRSPKERPAPRSRIMDVSRFFSPYSGRTALEIVDAVSMDFLGRKLDPKQRQAVAGVLTGGGPTNVPIRRQDYKNATAAAALHQLLCTAEYQLC